MRQAFYLVFTLSVILSSCSQSSNGSGEDQLDYSLSIVDSVRVDYAGRLNLLDVDPEAGLILAFDIQTRKFIVFDFQGEQQGEFSKDPESPEGYGYFPIAAAKIIDQKHILLISSNGVFSYDFQGGLVDSKRLEKDHVLPFSGRSDIRSEIFYHNGKFLLAGLIARGDYNKTQPEFYESFYQLAEFDTAKGKVRRLLKLEDESIFMNGNSHEPPTLSPQFTLVDNKLFVITGVDPYLNIYELDSSNSRIDRVALPVENYQLNPGEDPKKADPRAISFDPSFGYFNKMAHHDGLLIVSYFPGYNQQDQISSRENKSPAEWEAFNSQMQQKYNSEFLVLDKKGQLLSRIPQDKRLDMGQFGSREGSLWFLSRFNDEVEEDFWTFYKVQLEEKASD